MFTESFKFSTLEIGSIYTVKTLITQQLLRKLASYLSVAVSIQVQTIQLFHTYSTTGKSR